MSKKEGKKPENEAENAGAEAAETQNSAENTPEQAQNGEIMPSANAETGEAASIDAENPEDASGDGEEAAAEPSPEERIAELETRIAELRDQLLRKAADFENFRKRMNQEKQSAIEYANQSLLLDIIPVIDDFERAISAGETSADAAGFLEGVKMIEKRFTGILETKWGLKRFNSAGEVFDPNLHEALMMEKSPEVTEAVVQEDLQKGYMLKDRVIRAAKVKVLMPE